jgi:hypothetical protein
MVTKNRRSSEIGYLLKHIMIRMRMKKPPVNGPVTPQNDWEESDSPPINGRAKY